MGNLEPCTTPCTLHHGTQFVQHHLEKAGEELGNEVTTIEEPKNQSLTFYVKTLKCLAYFFSRQVSSAGGKKCVDLHVNQYGPGNEMP